MRHLHAALLIVLLSLSSAAAAEQEIHLFILSGQSNMQGLDPSSTFTPTVADEFGQENVVVVKDAMGGQPIRRWYKNWKPENGDTPKATGDLYDRLMGKVHAAIKGKKIASITFVWMQGERDARERHGRVYADSLEGLLTQLSGDLSRDDINCVIGRLSDFDLSNERYPHWTIVRKAQVEFAEVNPRRGWVDTDDLNDGRNRAGREIKNDLHYSVQGYETLGTRFAQKAIELVKSNAQQRAPAKTEDLQKSGRPNIILVMADDQGWGDTGFNGHPFVKTPTLDAMADEGFVFDRFYAASPVCSPTRASVMTGRCPIRAKVPNHGRYMRPHEQTIGESLKAAGYVTGMFGKSHLGSGQPDSPCNPGAMGFDEWTIGLNFFDNDPYLSRNGKVEHRRGKGSVILMDDTIEFLNEHKDGNRPMFTVVWFPSPHDPHQELPEGPSLYDGRDKAGYYREITLLDQQLGRLRRELKSMGIADNTILWYCSDNGGLVTATSGGRARKGSIYEGGLRVPAVVEWPARKLKGRTAVPVWTCDIYPTLMAMAGVQLDAPHPLDGIDVSDIIAGKAQKRGKPMGFWHNFQSGQSTWSDRILKAVMEKQQAGAPLPHNPARIRKDVDEFPQFPEDISTGHAAWNAWPWKLHRINGERYELYNLADDPMETTDYSTDPQHQQRLERMKGELDAWMRSVIRSLNGEDYRSDPQSCGEFESIFNGRDLSGWEGIASGWEVRDGAIWCTGGKGNQWLIYRGGVYEDLELRLQFKYLKGNSGVQVRSAEFEPFQVRGYQAEIATQNKMGLWHHSKAPEKYRSKLSLAGQKVHIAADGQRTVEQVSPATEVQAAYREGQWNEMVITACDDRLVQRINGVVFSELIDEETKYKMTSGVIALQDHGSGTQVGFKDIRLRELKRPDCK